MVIDLKLEWKDIRDLLNVHFLEQISVRTVAISIFAYESDRRTFFGIVWKQLCREATMSLWRERRRFERGKSDVRTFLEAMKVAQQKVADYLIKLRGEVVKIDEAAARKYFPLIILPEQMLLFPQHDDIWKKPGVVFPDDYTMQA
ncbi:MAG TPA: hypothetical protein VJH94_03555 [Candidatus Paceibacterota bacterium]